MITVLKIIFRIVLAVTLIVWVTGCSHNAETSTHQEHLSVGERVRQQKDSIRYAVSTGNAMQQVRTVLADVHDTVSFLIPERTSMIKSFPCTNCHTKPVEQLALGRKPDEKKAHWDVTIIHGNADVMNCQTCHQKKNFNELVSLTGTPIQLNQSFKLCSQCHSTQFKDWVGGAHGKRLGGWAPPKVMNSCVNCHNPHKPAFESKWPARLNTKAKSKLNQE